MTTTKKTEPETPSIEIINTAKCKTLSGKSTLTYHIGRNDQTDIFMRIYSNTNEGFFSNEWIPLNDILAILEKQGESSFTSFILQPLFKGQSVNTPAFLVAALLNEKVLRYEKNKVRKYVFDSSAAFLSKIDKLKPVKTSKKSTKKSS